MDPPQTHVVPSKLEVDFDKNMTQLYEAITNCQWSEAISIAKAHPNEARTWVVRYYDNEDGDVGDEPEIMWRFLPLHSACARQPPAGVISALLHAYPDGAKCIDDQGMFPLHYACGNQASREVIRLLLMTYNDAAKHKDPRGMLPIHYLACWGPSAVSVIDMVLVAYREVANAKDEDGNTPLDLAVDSDYPERDQVVAALRRWLENTRIVSSESEVSDGSSKLAVDTSLDEKKEETPDAQGAVTSPRTVGRLRQEITKLRGEQRKLDAMWEERMNETHVSLNDKVNAMQSRVKQLEEENSDSSRSIANLQSEVQEKDSEARNYRHRYEATEAALKKSLDERDGLRQTLADLTEQHDTYKKKAEMMNDRLGSLNASLQSMMEQQKNVLDAMKAREEQWEALAKMRKSKVEELFQLECDVPTDETDFQTIATRQTREMEAIAAVIAAVRQQG